MHRKILAIGAFAALLVAVGCDSPAERSPDPNSPATRSMAKAEKEEKEAKHKALLPRVKAEEEAKRQALLKQIPSYTDWPFNSTEAKRRQSATAKALGLKGTTKTLKLPGGKTLELVLIPAGTFTMGSPEGEDGRQNGEGPQRKVTISKPFWLGKTEVTQAQYEAVTSKSPWKGGTFYAKADPQHAASHVSWNDATAFCKALSQKTGKTVRLPTEAEWEYACRAGTTTRFSFGDRDEDLHKYGNYCDKSNTNGYPWQDKAHDDGHDKTAPAGSYKPNAWGLYDMHGNVWEWCSDWYQDSYKGLATTGPKSSNNGKGRVVRGGSWDYIAALCRSANRSRVSPDDRINGFGFRVAVSVSRVD